MPTIKELKSLAKACQKIGIKHYKCADFEFTLSDVAPVETKNKATKALSNKDLNVPTDSLTDDQFLYWSSAGLSEDEATQ